MHLLLPSHVFLACLWGFSLTRPFSLVHEVAGGLGATAGSPLVASKDPTGCILYVTSRPPNTWVEQLSDYLNVHCPGSYLTNPDGSISRDPDLLPTGMFSHRVAFTVLILLQTR